MDLPWASVAFERLLDFFIGTGECGAGSTYIIYIDLYAQEIENWSHLAAYSGLYRLNAPSIQRSA